MADDWDSDPDYVNDLTERQQRYGSKQIHQPAVNMRELVQQVKEDDRVNKLKLAPKPSGYGGKFGVEKDRMDTSAVGWDHVEQTQKHASQKDYSSGFGGKYGVQKDRQDKSAVGWDHVEKTEKHASQKDYSSGFGGKYGVQKDRQDKSAVNWNYKAEVKPHSSQTDSSHGFGGKFGVEKDRVDASAVGWRVGDSSGQEMAKHTSQEKREPPRTGICGLASRRERFEYGSASTAQSSGPTAGQLRVQQERARWAAEREAEKAAATEEPSSAAADVSSPAGDTRAQAVKPPFPKLSEPEVPVEPDRQEEEKPSVEAMEPSPHQPEEEQEDLPQPEPFYSRQDAQITAEAAYDYTANADDELSFKAGDVITNVSKVDAGWWWGFCNGREGLFPANHTKETT